MDLRFDIRALIALSAMLVATAVAGCTSDSHEIGGEDAGPGGDGSTPGTDGGGGVACGPTTCAAGQVCCNASCGICTEPGGTCTEMACIDGGTGGEPCGPTTCAAGQVCCNASCGICTAPGEGCIAIACEDAGPGTRHCGDGLPDACTPEEFCAYESGCGGSGATGVCTVPPDACEDVYAPVCGCDGRTYGNSCEARAASVNVAHEGECPTSGDCAPMDAHGEGPCDAFFGYAWNGRTCYGISGCDCVGTDCGRLYMSPGDCETAHAHCPGGTGGSCGGFAGDTCSDDEWCDYPDSGPTCGRDDGTGTCRMRPGGCIEIYDPVCGCDGMTHSNECAAHAAGTDVAYDGECRSSAGSP